MTAMLQSLSRSDRLDQAAARPSPQFDLDDDAAYQRWRAAKLARFPVSVEALIVDVADPHRLSQAERAALLQRCQRANMAIYRGPAGDEDRALPRALGRQLGLHRLDLNWLAEDDGVSRITVSQQSDERGGFIPYTDRPLRWHTDGYYQAPERRIESVILHCVRPAPMGGANALLDHEMAYIALRDTHPEWIAALQEADAMTIPARTDASGPARAMQSGPVFAVAAGGSLQMRYTARSRSIEWKPDPLLQQALTFLQRLLASDSPWIFRIRLLAGMGIVSGNVLHDREAFSDDPEQPRLMYRARYLDRIDLAQGEEAWRKG